MWLLKVKAPPLPILLAEIYRSGEVQDVSNLERTPFRFSYPSVYEWSIICLCQWRPNIYYLHPREQLMNDHSAHHYQRTWFSFHIISGEEIHSIDKNIQLPTVLLHSQGTTKLHYLSQTYSLTHSLTHSLAPPSPVSFSFFFRFLFFVFFPLLFFLLLQKSLQLELVFRSISQPLRESWHAVFCPQSVCAVYLLFFCSSLKSSPSLASPLHLVLYHAKCINQVVIGKLCQVPRGSVITKTGNLVSSFQPRATSRTTREVSSLLSKITRTSRNGIHLFLFLFSLWNEVN